MKINFFNMLFLITAVISACHAQDNTQVDIPNNVIARFGGKGEISVMEFSPDGNHLAVATEIGVWFYDVSNGKGELLHRVKPEAITAILFSSDGKKLVCASATNQVIQLWDISGEEKKHYLTLYDRFDTVIDLVFSKDNRTLYSLSRYGYLAKWDLNLRKEVSAIQFSENRSIAAFADDGKKFIHEQPNDSSIKIWKIDDEIFSDEFESDTNPKTINGIQKDTDIQNSLTVLGISSDNNTIVSTRKDNIIRLWDSEARTLRYSLERHTKRINSVAFSPDNKILATGGDDKRVMLWDIEKGKLHKTLTGHISSIRTIVFSPTNSDQLASGSSDGTIRFWNTQTGQELQTLTEGHIDSIHDLAFSEDNTVLSAVTSEGAIHVWDIKTGKTLPTPNVESLDINRPLSLSHDATILAYNGIDIDSSSSVTKNGISEKPRAGLKLWLLPLGEQISVSPQNTLSLTFSSDSKMLAFSDPLSGLKIWSIEAQSEISSIKKKFSHPTEMEFSPDGILLAVNDAFSNIEVWDTNTQRIIPMLNMQDPKAQNTQDLKCLTFSPDSSMLALKHTNYIDIYQIDPSGMALHRRFTPDGSLGTSDILVFSPNGKLLLDVDWVGNDIQIWELDSENLLGTFSVQSQPINKLVFSHDGNNLACGSMNGIVLIWDWEKVLQDIKKK